MSTNLTGFLDDNNTWTHSLGELQSATVDTLSIGAYITLARSKDFKYTTPYTVRKYGAIMKRQTSKFYVDIDTVTAGLDAWIYGMFFLILMILLFVSWCHERISTHFTSQSKCSNTLWDLLISLFPANAGMWPNQFGATRKLLISTIGYAILILSALYQARLSEQLLIPYPPPVVTLTDIEQLVESGNAQLLVDGDTVRKYVASVSPLFGKAMKTAAQLNFEWIDYGDALYTINTYNAILIDTNNVLMGELLASTECANYVYVPFDDWTRIYRALIIRNGRVDILESMNVIVAERMSFIDTYFQSFQLSEECRQHIFPVYIPNPKFEPLPLLKITGALALLFLFLCSSVFVLFAEIIWYNWRGAKMKTKKEFQTFVIHLNIDNTFSSERREAIFKQYLRLLDVIDT